VAMNAACLRVEQMAKGSQVIDVPMAVFEFLQNDPPAELRARALQANAAVLRRLGNETAAAALDARALGKPASAAPPLRGPAGPDVNITTELYEDAAPFLRWIRPDIDDRSAGEMAFALDRSNLLAFRSVTASRSKRFWRLSLPREVVSSETGTQTAVKFPAISIQNGVLTCVRADSGAAVFTYQLDGDVESSTAAGGVLLLTERSAEPGTPVRLAAYDAVGGAPLWQADLDARGGPYVLVASETDTLALGLGAREPRVKLRFDTLTGDVKSAVPSAASLDKQLADLSQWRRDYESASQKRGDRGGQFRDLAITDRMREFREWFSLYNGVLVYFVKHQADAYQSRIVGLHLGDGSGGDAPKTWELAASKTPKTRLGNVLFAPNDVLVLRQSGDGGTTQDKMEVLRLDPATGEATQVALVPFGAQLAGAEWDTPLRWNQPGLLTFTAESGAASTRLDFVDLQNRRAWSRSIPIRLSLVERPPMPAIGNNVIGIAYSTTPARSSGTTPSQHELRLLRRDTGDYAADLAFPLNDGKPLGFVLTDSSFFAMSGQPLYRASIRRFFGSESNR
jgi:hypothetical protein